MSKAVRATISILEADRDAVDRLLEGVESADLGRMRGLVRTGGRASIALDPGTLAAGMVESAATDTQAWDPALAEDLRRDALSLAPSGVATLATATLIPNRHQPRRGIDQQALAVLAEDIREHGILEPLLVRPVGRGFEIIAGERRWRAAQCLKIDRVPCIVRPADDALALELALSENLSRHDLTPIEEAAAFSRWLELSGRTQVELAQRLGVSQPAICNRIRLLQLPQSVQEAIHRGELSASHGQELLQLQGPSEALEQLATVAAREHLSQRDLHLEVHSRRDRQRASRAEGCERCPTCGQRMPKKGRPHG